jgi:hypothetical protein
MTRTTDKPNFSLIGDKSGSCALSCQKGQFMSKSKKPHELCSRPNISLVVNKLLPVGDFFEQRSRSKSELETY